MTQYPKRLIEVDLPIKRISAHARREKSIRHGHISTLHIWWARRPLAACRAVICASLWPDPADKLCPPVFIKQARKLMLQWTTHERQNLLSAESRARFEAARQQPKKFDDATELRGALLDFIADFANWDSSTVPEFLDTSRALTQAAHEALGGAPGTRPLVVDPFAGGGSIPLEALRVGADAFASDLNPVPVLLNKVVLEYIPKYGQRLADEVRKWGEWIKCEAEKELAEFYPKDTDGATPIAYLWARKIQCEGPGCGAEVPLIRSLWLAKKSNRSVGLQLMPNPKAKRVDFQIIVKQRDGWVDQANPKVKIENPKFDGTVKRGSVTCHCCGYTTPVARVREQLKARQGGANDARLLCVVTTKKGEASRLFRLATQHDFDALRKAANQLTKLRSQSSDKLTLVPEETLPIMSGVFNAPIYGHNTWGSVFTSRQLLGLTTLARLARDVSQKIPSRDADGLNVAVQLVLALGVSRIADIANALCTWKASMVQAIHLFTRQAIPMMWDFTETALFSDAAGDYGTTIGNMVRILEGEANAYHVGHVERSSATKHPLPNDSADAFITDPPYYNAVPYADLSDFFYVWLKRMLFKSYPDLFATELSPKDDEACQMSGWDPVRYAHKDAKWFEVKMSAAMKEGRRVLRPEGIGIVVFAHKSTAGWEAQLQAMIDAGWIMTGSWPIDTEMGNRLRAVDSAALASSIHLVCRPRENLDGSVRTDEIGDWRDVLQELPRRIHEWMPRLAEEGVVGADAIFACLGPALEIFSRYSRVEKASGETVTLKEYLEQVWAAVAKEALALVFKDADVTGFEADARLTAMWLWTLNAGNTDATNGDSTEDDDADDESEGGSKKAKAAGFVLEYDAARKIAQGLGANLENLDSLVEVSGETARLLPVGERAHHLFGKDEGKITPARKKKVPQLDLFKVLEQADDGGTTFGETKVERHGETVLDRIHQSMILFAAGRSEAMKRFLVEDGAGRDPRFWRLAQALSALYPPQTEEKRWVDGVLARKKGLGF
jgi:adenine-specific DNA methylase